MYKGENPTAIQSKNWFAQAMLRLMKDHAYKDISVSMLCVEADLSRQTFYNLFEDKDAVLLYYLGTSHYSYFYGIALGPTVQVRSFVDAFAKYIDTHEEVLQMLVDNHLELLLHKAISDGVARVADIYAKTPETKYGTAFLSGALTQTILCWIYDEKRISASELTELIEQILAGQYYRV